MGVQSSRGVQTNLKVVCAPPLIATPTSTLSTLASVYSFSSAYSQTRHVISTVTSTESVLAIGVGLVLRIVVDVATDNDDRVGGVLVGLWEGVVLNHFVRRMPHSFDPYLGFGFRIFVDFLFTQSLSRLALVALWALVGMLLADIAPNIWHDSGLRHLYRQVRRDVRHVKRAVPHIRIENDLPSVRLFSRSRSTSSEMSGSIRSDRAAPSRSQAPSPAPVPGSARRLGRSPPGTFPDVSGWSETATDISDLRERIVTTPGPSPALIPSREYATHARDDTTHVTTSQVRTTVVQDSTITTTQIQSESVLLETVVGAGVLGATAASTSLEPIDDPSRHNPLTIPDDWVEVSHPAPPQLDEPVAPLQSDLAIEPQPGPSVLTQSRPTSILGPPPVIDALPDIPDVDLTNRKSRLPDQIPLPESRAASVIGGVYDQPQPRGTLRDNFRSHIDKTASEIGMDPARSLASLVDVPSRRSQSMPRSSTGLAATSMQSKLKQSVSVDAPEPSTRTLEESAGRDKSGVGSAAQGVEPQIPTPAQVDPPTNILTQPGDTSPLLLQPVEPKPGQQEEQLQAIKPDLTPVSSAGVDGSPSPLQGGTDKRDTAEPSKAELFDVPSPPRSPPPPFTEFAGVGEGPAAGEAPADQDPVTQDDGSIELTEEQKVVEEKRVAFLTTQVQELERTRSDLQKKLKKANDPNSRSARAIESDLEDAEKSVNDVNARIAKKKFSEPPSSPSIKDILLSSKTSAQVQFEITSAVMAMLLERDDVRPMTIQAVISKQNMPGRKAKETKDALSAFVKRHNFSMQSEPQASGTISITF